MSHTTSVEGEIRTLLEDTRREAEMYSSAHYRDLNTPGKDGLNMRLSAIENGLLRLAAAIDRK